MAVAGGQTIPMPVVGRWPPIILPFHFKSGQMLPLLLLRFGEMAQETEGGYNIVPGLQNWHFQARMPHCRQRQWFVVHFGKVYFNINIRLSKTGAFSKAFL